MRHVHRGGAYVRVTDPSWKDPLSGKHAHDRGGRWNAPGSFAVVYLNASADVARALVRSRLEDRGVQPEDVLPEAGPVLVHTTVPEDAYVNAVTNAGLRALRLPTTYPLDSRGKAIPHRACQPIGHRAWDAGERGIACRSATTDAHAHAEELAYFNRRSLRAKQTERFADWFS